MSLINISDLTFAYEGSYDNIFENVNFQIDTNWKLGFTGRNGRGKTTFLNLLIGKYEYSGTISANVNFQYFPQHVLDKTATTGTIARQIAPLHQDWQLMRELSLLGIAEDVLSRPFATLSNGEQTKVLLAMLFLNDNHFLLIDEPTNHLDIAGREVVSHYLNSKTGFILVSHDRAFLDGCIDHTLSINKTNIDVQSGNFSSWLANKQRQDNFEIAENEKLKKDIKRLQKTAREKAEWSDKVEASKIGQGIYDRGYVGHKAAKMMKHSKSLENRMNQAVEEKSKLLKNIDHASALKIAQMPYHKQRYLSLRDVSIFYGDKKVCDNIGFDINRGDRVALRGSNGSGKSSILKLICGQPIAHTGELSIGSGLQISYVQQDTSFLSGNLTDFARQSNIDESLFKAILRKLDFSRIQLEKDMCDFSGGQKKKVLIARSLCEKSHLLIWDEPLNFIDVLSRMQIEELLLQYKPTILFVEHDNVFCKKIATKFSRFLSGIFPPPQT